MNHILEGIPTLNTMSDGPTIFTSRQKGSRRLGAPALRVQDRTRACNPPTTLAAWSPIVASPRSSLNLGALGIGQPDFSSSAYQAGADIGIAAAALTPGDEEAADLDVAEDAAAQGASRSRVCL